MATTEQIEKVAAAIEAVQLFSRFNDWTSDRVHGFPVEICRHADGDIVDPVVVARYPAGVSEQDALSRTVRRVRAVAAIKAMRD
jgi:hypothetical protein